MAFEVFVVNASDGHERFVFMNANVYKTQSWIIECEWADPSQIPNPEGEIEIGVMSCFVCGAPSLRQCHVHRKK